MGGGEGEGGEGVQIDVSIRRLDLLREAERAEGGEEERAEVRCTRDTREERETDGAPGNRCSP